MPARRVLLLLLLALFACDDEGDAHFTIKFASDFAPTQHAVSVLGVYQDGQMSPRGWEALAPYVVPALGSAICDVGYDSLTSTNTALADAIDGYTREDGPTDDLLTQLAPAAQGDLVLVLIFAGKLPQHATDAGATGAAPAQSAMGGRGGGGRRGGGRMGGRPKAESAKDPNVLDISASLFSVAQGRSVALVGMQYSGTSIADAMTRFAKKLAQAVPNMTCVRWNWNANIDPARIRPSTEE
ncbi:MAG: hypothetical protein ACLP1X_02130 [Polyangiaceae bacterium]